MDLGFDLQQLLGLTPTAALAVITSTAVLYLAFAGLLAWASQRLFSSPSALDAAMAGVLGAIIGRTMLGTFPTLSAALLSLLTLVGMELALGRVRMRAMSNPQRQHAVALVVAGTVNWDRLGDFQLDEVSLWQLLRTRGVGDLAEVRLLVIERSGDISLIRSDETISPAAITGIRDPDSVRAGLELSG